MPWRLHTATPLPPPSSEPLLHLDSQEQCSANLEASARAIGLAYRRMLRTRKARVWRQQEHARRAEAAARMQVTSCHVRSPCLNRLIKPPVETAHESALTDPPSWKRPDGSALVEAT